MRSVRGRLSDSVIGSRERAGDMVRDHVQVATGIICCLGAVFFCVDALGRQNVGNGSRIARRSRRRICGAFAKSLCPLFMVWLAPLIDALSLQEKAQSLCHRCRLTIPLPRLFTNTAVKGTAVKHPLTLKRLQHVNFLREIDGKTIRSTGLCSCPSTRLLVAAGRGLRCKNRAAGAAAV